MTDTHTPADVVTTYQVVDSRTGAVLSTHASRTRAVRKANRLDLEYGGVRYIVRVKWDIA